LPQRNIGSKAFGHACIDVGVSIRKDHTMHSLSPARSASSENFPAPAVDRTAGAAHRIVDTLADQALTGVGNVSGSLHVAVNHAADAVTNAADWVAHVPATLQRRRTRLADATFNTIKARPFLTLGGAIAVGIIIGRLARR
jgi:ElaB/YqjD/DUF883 family membrane-anchored ribosome-binding protein